MSRTTFVLKLIRKYATLQDRSCPYCGSRKSQCIGRKNVILQLRRCNQCDLMFRYPKNDRAESHGFYQKDYQQRTVTKLPTEDELENHIRTRFAKVGRDLAEHLSVIRELVPQGRVLDYGCSWGYCVFQFREAGYDAVGFEVSASRVEYGRTALRVDLSTDVDHFPDASFDLIYSAHVLEHVDEPASVFRDFQRLLKPGGKFFLFVPNCAGNSATRLQTQWGPMLGEKHVLALTPEFFQRNLTSHGFSLSFASSPYAQPPRQFEDNPDVTGDELLVVGQRT